MKELILAFFVLVIGIFGLTVYLAPNDLSRCDTAPYERNGCQAVDAIVAVSGGDTTARTNEAIALYKDGWAPKLVFSGAALDKSGPSNALVMSRQALAGGVPQEAIEIDEDSATTQQNAERTDSILRANRTDSIILVTSGYHQRRANLEFHKRLGDSIKIVNHPVPTDDQWSRWWWLTPTGWYLAGSELIKIVVFYIGGSSA